MAFPARTTRGAPIRATRECRNSEPAFRRSAIHRRGRPPIATRGRPPSAATSRRSHPTTTSDSGIVSTTCTWTTGSRNGRTRAGGSTSPPTPRARSAPARRAANFYNQYAAFLLGLVGTARKSYQYELFTGREWQHAMYVRDRWTVNQKLTLDLGVRWEYYPIMTPRRSADRDARPQHARRPDWRGRRQPEEHGPGGAEGRVRAEDRRRLSPQRRDGVPQRLWRHARRAEACRRRKRSAATSATRSC